MKNSYRHQKGQINDNALQALLHDPLFKVRVEKNKKGKGSYQRQEKFGKGKNWEASCKQVNHFFTTGLLYTPSDSPVQGKGDLCATIILLF